MKQQKVRREFAVPQKEEHPNDSPHEEVDTLETTAEADERGPDEADLEDVDDERWDVFVLDEDGDPLPEYGDFWFPD